MATMISGFPSNYKTPAPIGTVYELLNLIYIGDPIITKRWYTGNIDDDGTSELGGVAIRITNANGTFDYSINGSGEVQGDNTFTVERGLNTITYRFIRYNAGVPEQKESSVFTIYGVENKLPLVPWSVQDVIERILDLQKPLLSNGTADISTKRFTFDLSTIPADKREIFTRRDCPEFTFTRMTVREALKKIGGYIHAEPRLLYNNQSGEFDIITFDFYGGTDYAEYYDVILKRIERLSKYNYEDKTYSWNVEQGCTELDSYVDNFVNRIKQGAATVGQPWANGQQNFRTENAYARFEDDGLMYFPTQYPISDIDKFYWHYNGEKYDLTPWLYEQSIYNAQLSSYADVYPFSKAYGLYYTLNGKGIRGFFFRNAEITGGVFAEYAIVNIIKAATGIDIPQNLSTYKSLQFSLTYTPIYSARVRQSKVYANEWLPYERAINYAQSDNMVETQYFGENIKGAVERLGTLEKLYTFTCFNLATIPKAGELWDADYYIATVAVECMFDNFKVSVGLSKNFNRLSQYIGVSSYKRVYEVSERMVQDRDTLWQDYIMFTDYQETPVIPAQADCLISQKVLNGVLYAVGGSSVDIPTKATAMVLQGYTKTLSPLTNVILPCVASAEGNAMAFTAEYADNFSAGQTYKVDTTGAAYGVEVEYADYYGRMYFLNWKICAPDGTESAGQTFPLIDTATVAGITNTTYISTGNNYQKIRKDNREKLRINVSIQFVTDSNTLVIGSALARNHALITEEVESVRLLLLNRKIGKFDSVIDPSDILADLEVPSQGQRGNGYISFNSTYIQVPSNLQGLTIPAWAIVTQRKTETKYYSDEGNNRIEVTENSGGELLIGRNEDMQVEQGELYINGFTAFGVHDVIKYMKSKS